MLRAHVIELKPAVKAVIKLTTQEALNDARRAVGHGINVVASHPLLDARCAALRALAPWVGEKPLRQRRQSWGHDDPNGRHIFLQT
jgi:hypothetical protein